MKKLKASNGNKDNGMVAYMEEALKNKFEEFRDQGKATNVGDGHPITDSSPAPTVAGRLLPAESLEFTHLLSTVGLIMSTEGQLSTQSHQEGTSDPTRINTNETLRSMQQSIKGLAIQFQSVARDMDEIILEELIHHHQRPYDNMSTQGYHDMSVHNPYPFHEVGFQGRPQARGGRRGGQGGRGYYRPHEEVPRHEAWHHDNLFDDFGEDPNIFQAYHGGYYGNQQGDKALDKIKWNVPSFKGDSDPNMKKLKASNGNEDNGMVAYMEKALKNKFEEYGDQGKASKLFSICSLSNDHSRKQLEGENWLSVEEGHPTVDSSPAPTIAGRLLPAESLEFTYLPPIVGSS
ncbi:hypothetical protein M9H77_07146 [Catharanthus roseus]|uniref:Uncharacterized protein n=1 Tax=Catharanthus roseus TaxID=4058 RepID=A0ACC0BUD4_CATRO|nr:hypothetical protein M9H77_07146 [Catharanthus roseus]